MRPAQNPTLSRIKMTHFCRQKGKENERKMLDLSKATSSLLQLVHYPQVLSLPH